jgi:very-short-patch-repair endonuclease
MSHAIEFKTKQNLAVPQPVEYCRRAAEHRSKANRLVEFLSRIAQLRTKLIRDLSDYARVVWLNDVPRQKGCYAQAWGRDEEFDTDIWIAVQNQREPELPRIPPQCEDWVDRSILRDKCALPKLISEITRQVENPARQDGSDLPEFISYADSIEDHPELQTAWNRYVEERWKPWAVKHTEWDAANKVYSALFAIHQDQLRSGEEYELVLGIGLLCWQTPSGQRIRRHLLVANALIEFEAKLGKFTVRPMPDGANLRPELDMLDIEEQPALAEDAAKSALTSATDDPWEKTCVEGVLQALVHSISPQGEYLDTLGTTGIGALTKPIVEYAPALILRKRSEKGLSEALKRIKEQIENGGDIPGEFRDLAELRMDSDIDSESDQDATRVDCEGEVFFPKPSNAEQRRIVEKLRAANGVLVQGPPGTGKSHTIANLICHLLATGQRTLVTAKTPRALQVLQQLLPEELRPLCINLLGSGLEEKRSLEASVGGILRKRDTWDEKRVADEHQRLAQELRRLREEKATFERRLRDIRESETHRHSIGEGRYQGTAARIADAVNRDRRGYEWFAHSAEPDKSCPVNFEHLRTILLGLRKFTPEIRQELSCSWPVEVPSVESFSELVEVERTAIEEERRLTTSADEQLAEQLCPWEASDIELVQASFSAFCDARRRQTVSTYPWMPDAVRDVIGCNSQTWRELLRITTETISTVEAGVARADDTKLSVRLANGNVVSDLHELDARLLCDDAHCLKQHLEHGGKLGFWILRPPVVKERQYLLHNVRINGQVCNSVEQLTYLVDLLRVQLAFDKAWEFWAGRIEQSRGPYALQLGTLQSLRTALGDALSIEGMIEKCREALHLVPNLREPNWLDEYEIDHIIASCKLALGKQALRNVVARLQAIEEPIVKSVVRNDAHSAADEMLQAIRNRDVHGFAQARDKLKRLEEEHAELNWLDESVSELRCDLPGFAEDLIETCNDACWDDRVQRIQHAWCWDQARFWIEEYTRKEDVPSLAKRVRQLEEEINAVTAKLASLLAWSHCFSRLSEDHRRHMVAWQQSMKKLGKGTGKYASKHRRDAQHNLNQCRAAVPAWIMPLHRVWDTVRPAPEMFDVVIIDEASQCGLESLPLLYLAKRILIVGDDKQISPEAVGVEQATVHQLVERYLYDFELKTCFDIQSSLFDHGKLRYGTGQIILREHFRCMPEIIRFSNDLCYSDTPLIPLRQFGKQRLNPLEHRFVGRGYREGSGNRVVNRPEAEDLVATIVELCEDPSYADKSMGVVVLQGEAQASVIEELLLKQLGAEEMGRRRLICGDSSSFQGDERDVMFLSMVAATNESIGPLTKSSDERRFNVAASRARDQLWLFHSVHCEDLSPSCLRRRLLEFFVDDTPQQVGGLDRDELERRSANDNRSLIRPPQPFDSWFEVDVALELVRRGFNVIPQYEIAGKRIDLFVEGGRARLAVECDGDHWHGADQYEADMQRQRQLERCGCEFFRVRESAFYSNGDSTLVPLWHMLEERSILSGFTVAAKSSETGEEDRDELDCDVVECADAVHDDDHVSLNDSENDIGRSARRADDVSTEEIQNAIVRALSKCPNQSCTVHSLTSRVLKEVGVLTRGNPRVEFERRVMRSVSALEKREQIERYKAKNRRVRLACNSR